MSTEKGDEAIPFITFKEKEGFRLNPEAEDFLRSLDPKRKVAVISIVGKYRTGKSFFVNRVLLNRAGKKAGFSVGPTINPCTKGLWIWKECLFSDELQEEVDVILIDTEGFGGMDENQNHDSRIFLFSLLLSSYFIYNSQGNIDETALNNISLIINLSKDIRVSDSSSNDEDVAEQFPSFLWVVRDFALKMEDNQGQKITSKDYLERALEHQKGVSDAIESKNKIRRQLKHFFKDRDCQTLIRPIESEKDLQRLNDMKDEDLRPEFVSQMNSLRKRIFRKLKPKVVNGRSINGFQLVEICKAYLVAVNKGGMPNIENAWTSMCKNESLKAIEETISSVESDLNSYFKCETNEPLSAQQLHNLKAKMKEDIIKQFKKKSIASEEELKEFYDQLDREFADKFKEFKKKNKEKLQVHFEEVCVDRIKEFEQKLNNEDYLNFFDFEKDFSEFQQAFQKSVGQSEESDEYFKKVSERIYKKAAEKVSQRQQRELEKDRRLMEQRQKLVEIDLDKNKNLFEEEKRKFNLRISELEKERSQLLANDLYQKEIASRLTQERDRLQNSVDQMNQRLILAQEKVNSVISVNQEKYSKDLEIATGETRVLEKKSALLEQELQFSRKENERLSNEVVKYEQTNKSQNTELIKANSLILQLRNEIETSTKSKQVEIDQMKADFKLQLAEARAEIEQTKHKFADHTELLKENTFLNGQMNFLRNQLDENKRLHDALLLALQQGMQKEEDENTNELVETNKNLSAAMDKLEQRCGMLDNKIQGLKEFKRMVKTSNSMQCIQCSKHIPTQVFLQHINTCPPQSAGSALLTNSIQNSQLQQNVSNIGQSQNSSNIATNIQFNGQVPTEQQPLLLTISQTIIKQSTDTQKPYTEYIIQVALLNYPRWEISRKYKNFCELHHALKTQFPSMKFPESSLAIINMTSETNGANQKRPQFIEERRRALQQYIKDLSRIEVICNSKPFRTFLEIDSHLQTVVKRSQSISSQSNQKQQNAFNSSYLNSSQLNITSARLLEKENSEQNLAQPKQILELLQRKQSNSTANFNFAQNKENNKFIQSRSKSVIQQQQQEEQFIGHQSEGQYQPDTNEIYTSSPSDAQMSSSNNNNFSQVQFNKQPQRQYNHNFTTSSHNIGQTAFEKQQAAANFIAAKVQTYQYNFQKQQSQRSSMSNFFGEKKV